MALNPEIHDQAYQFFIEEAPELLQAIETGLLELRCDRSAAQIHGVMRAAHSLKGGAATLGFEAIKTIAHRLETIFRALYSDTVELDTDLESDLLKAYDCLRLPVLEQIETGSLDEVAALTTAEPIFLLVEAKLGDALLEADHFLPSSSDLGVDMVQSLFEVDVQESLDRLAAVLAEPANYEVMGELQAQIEVFAGFAELLNLPGFGAIAQATSDALAIHPERAMDILQWALADFQAGRAAVLEGDRTQGGTPSEALLTLANSASIPQTILQDGQFLDLDELSDISQTTPQDGQLPDWNDLHELSDFQNSSEYPMSDEIEESNLLEALHPHPLNSLNITEETLYSLDNLEHVAPKWLEHFDEALDEAGNVSEFLERFEANPEPVDAEHSDAEDQAIALKQNLFNPDEFSPDDLPYALIDPSPLLEDKEFRSQELEASITPDSWLLIPDSCPIQLSQVDSITEISTETTIADAIQAAEKLFDQLPSLAEIQLDLEQASLSSLPPLSSNQDSPIPYQNYLNSSQPASSSVTTSTPPTPPTPPTLSVRVEQNRLERMNNLVGALAISRNSLSLQNDQLQGAVRELLDRFARFQRLVGRLQDLSDQMLITPTESHLRRPQAQPTHPAAEFAARGVSTFSFLESFDLLEMDRYSTLHTQLQEFFEEVMQLEESVGDISLFAGQSNQTLGQHRQTLTQLRDELVWARMLPLGNVLNRFPRMLRDLSAKYHKSVNFNVIGASVLVDRVVIEKLYDPLLHLLRNAFDHGIESPELRQQRGKPEYGSIEVHAYHRGNQTIIEVRDDGNGLDLERIRYRALELGWLSTEHIAIATPSQLFSFIFEPGFSTASQVSELSGRGVGLDVVQAQLRSLKGTITVASTPGQGTTFTLCLPLTLTIAKLLVCQVNSIALALPSNSIEEILVPAISQLQQSTTQRFLNWRNQLIPVYRISHLLPYVYPLIDSSISKALTTVPSPKDWALPLLIMRRDQQVIALEVDRLLTEQELVIKPFGTAIAPPAYTYGCATLADGSLVPVIDGYLLVDHALKPSVTLPHDKITIEDGSQQVDPIISKGESSLPNPYYRQTKTILVVDDSAILRRTLALSLEKAGYRVLQAQDGQEALDQLHHSPSIQLVVCDVEMPNMNGFEFLSHRRQDPQIAAIPVVMLTSRSSTKHRQLAMHLKATAYYTKPYIESEFLKVLDAILAEQSIVSRSS